MKKASLTLMILLSTFLCSNNAHAASVVGFNPGRIIDDIVMTNNQSMSVSQIQTFLNSKVPVCDNWGTNGTTSTSRRDYFNSKGYPIPLTCLKDYQENGKNSAQIIYDVAQEFKINPQVLIVLLQKEQGLITDDWPDPIQYRAATGYGCPDTSVCDSQYYGLTNQLSWSARMFRAILNDSPTWYTPYEVGNNYIQYNPDSECGGTNVYIQNRSTQALYNYTPYQPNQSALNAGYGSGDYCSAYGNRNFYLYFTDWFGNTYGILTEIEARYNQISSSIGKLIAPGYCNIERTFCWQQFENGYIIWSDKTGAWESKGVIRDYWASIGYQSSSIGLPIGPVVVSSDSKTSWQEYQNGYIIWSDKTGAWESKGVIRDYWASIGYQSSSIGLPIGPVVVSSDSKTSWQEYQNGYIIWSDKTGAWESKGVIRDYWASIGYQSSSAGLPIGPEVYSSSANTWSQKYQNGVIIGSDKTGWHLVQTNINEYWQKLGAANSTLGLPINDQSRPGNMVWQEFERGFILYSPVSGAWESKGAIRDYWASIGYQSGSAGLPIGPEVYNAMTNTWSQEYKNGQITYSNTLGGRFIPNIAL